MLIWQCVCNHCAARIGHVETYAPRKPLSHEHLPFIIPVIVSAVAHVASHSHDNYKGIWHAFQTWIPRGSLRTSHVHQLRFRIRGEDARQPICRAVRAGLSLVYRVLWHPHYSIQFIYHRLRFHLLISRVNTQSLQSHWKIYVRSSFVRACIAGYSRCIYSHAVRITFSHANICHCVANARTYHPIIY